MCWQYRQHFEIFKWPHREGWMTRLSSSLLLYRRGSWGMRRKSLVQINKTHTTNSQAHTRGLSFLLSGSFLMFSKVAKADWARSFLRLTAHLRVLWSRSEGFPAVSSVSFPGIFSCPLSGPRHQLIHHPTDVLTHSSSCHWWACPSVLLYPGAATRSDTLMPVGYGSQTSSSWGRLLSSHLSNDFLPFYLLSSHLIFLSFFFPSCPPGPIIWFISLLSQGTIPFLF